MKNNFNSKKEFHKIQSKLPFEEKFKIIIELQKIDSEFNKYRKNKHNKKVWKID